MTKPEFETFLLWFFKWTGRKDCSKLQWLYSLQSWVEYEISKCSNKVE